MNQITNQTVLEFDDLDIRVITGGHKEGYHVVVHIDGKTCTDGAQYRCCHLRTTVEQIIPRIRGYSGHQLELVGQVNVQVVYEAGGHASFGFYCSSHKPALFGRNWMASVELNRNKCSQIVYSRFWTSIQTYLRR